MATHPPLPDIDLHALPLPELRAYRAALEAEEDRVSYWRRLLHARIDLVTAQAESGVQLSTADLVRVLGDTGSGKRRRALQRIRAAEPLPELPEVAAVWSDLRPGDPGEDARGLDALRRAEHQLTEYRRALHARIDQAAECLIERYRSDPGAALSLIPAE